MLSVQQIGTEILGKTPRNFYILGGTEYGIKERYIDVLKEIYDGNKIECPAVQDVINMMSKKHIVPLKPAVYVVRYDESFISSLSDALVGKIQKCKISGTIICIYESSKHISKCDKYLPENTVVIDNVNPQFIEKYLHSDFPELDDRFIKIAVTISSDYNQAKNMCRCMNCCSVESLYQLSDEEIIKTFGHMNTSTETQIRLGVASRNFKYLNEVIEKYPDDSDRILYCILQTMIELDKALTNPKSSSDVRPYLKVWTMEDVYYMFMHTYKHLSYLRSYSSYDSFNCLIYLISLLKFERIPSLEVMG